MVLLYTISYTPLVCQSGQYNSTLFYRGFIYVNNSIEKTIDREILTVRLYTISQSPSFFPVQAIQIYHFYTEDNNSTEKTDWLRELIFLLYTISYTPSVFQSRQYNSIIYTGDSFLLIARLKKTTGREMFMVLLHTISYTPSFFSIQVIQIYHFHTEDSFMLITLLKKTTD